MPVRFMPGRLTRRSFYEIPGARNLHGGIYRTQSLVLYLTDALAGSLIRYTLGEPTSPTAWFTPTRLS